MTEHNETIAEQTSRSEAFRYLGIQGSCAG